MTTNNEVENILKALPHRYPFLLVDRVLEQTGTTITVLKNVTINEPFFQGHFPEAPVMPGVLIVEAMAQAGGCLLFCHIGDRTDKLLYFSGIDNCRFRRPVVPGDQLILEVEVKTIKRNFAKLHGRATVDGELACEADLISAVVDRP